MSKAFVDQLTGGAWRGFKLALPQTEGVRPSKQRVRQAGFNLLASRLAQGHDFSGLNVADLCCGSGAWGLEAASRGAKAWLVDIDTAPANANVAAIVRRHPEAALELVQANVLTWQPPVPLDIIFTDPPYASALAAKLLTRNHELSRPGTWWLMETGPEAALDWPGFADTGHRPYGQSVLWWGRQI